MPKYLRMFESIAGLFPRPVRVTLIDAATGKPMGMRKYPPGHLPEAFNKPTMLQLDGMEWRVLKADPVDDDGIPLRKRITLHIQEWDEADPGPDNGLFLLPTVCDALPAVTTTPLFEDFTIHSNDDTWRQLEFIPAASLDWLQQQMTTIETILNPRNGHSLLLGYQNMHVREHCDWLAVSIPLDEFCSKAGVIARGAVQYNGSGYVENGFAIRTENHTWYGLLKNDIITTLCLQQFDSADEEFSMVTESYELMLADWCGARMIG